MRNFFILVLLCCASLSYTQNQKFNVALNYPVTIDKNFVGQSNNGIIDIGLKYRCANFKAITVGGSVNVGYLKNTKEDAPQIADINAYTLQPRIFAELNLDKLPKLHPSAGIGYSMFIFNAKLNNEALAILDDENQNSKEFGINLNLGIAYDITQKLMAQVQYDFVKINIDDTVPNIDYNRNINIIKIGLGYRF